MNSTVNAYSVDIASSNTGVESKTTAGEQFQKALERLRRRDPSAARVYLKRAASAGHKKAVIYLTCLKNAGHGRRDAWCDIIFAAHQAQSNTTKPGRNKNVRDKFSK